MTMPDINLANKFAKELENKIIKYYNDEYSGYPKNVLEKDTKVTVIPGKKYIKINIGSSGKFMLGPENRLYFIKGYGVPDLKKDFGNLEKILQVGFSYNGYSISKKGSGYSRTSYSGIIAETKRILSENNMKLTDLLKEIFDKKHGITKYF